MRRQHVALLLGVFGVFYITLLYNIIPSEVEKLTNTDNTVDKADLDTDSQQNVVKPQPTKKKEYQMSKYSRVHVFYYPWYANPAYDKELGWNHWNHNILPHWDANTKAKFPHSFTYEPPDDIGSCFYPARGPYSSSDPDLIDQHMQELKDYVVVVSWWGRGKTDGEGMSTDPVVPLLFKSAEKYDAKIAFHIEPYPGRSEQTLKEDLKYLVDKYGSSNSFYRDTNSGNRPVIYLYDSYHTKPEAWAEILDPQSPGTIRGTKYDAIILGLYLTPSDKTVTKKAHFDGVYTYFAADGFTDGSTSRVWGSIASWGREEKKIVSISIGPGYDDTRIRPWNSGNTKNRQQGKYYDDKWEKVLAADPGYVSITSYNEWMEGTQIESVVPKSIEKTVFDGKSYTYQDYSPLEPDYYIKKTAEWCEKLYKNKE